MSEETVSLSEENKLKKYLDEIEDGKPADFVISGPAALCQPIHERPVSDARLLANQYKKHLGPGVCLVVKTPDWGGVTISY